MAIYLDVTPLTRTPFDSPESYTYSGDDSHDWLIGQVVGIDFGRRSISGVIVGLKQERPEGFAIKPINKLISELPIFTSSQIELARWISTYYHCPLGIVLKTMSPKIPKRIVRPLEKPITESQAKMAMFFLQADQNIRFNRYIEEIKDSLLHKRQVTVIQPEIISVLQMADILSAAFPEAKIACLHSYLSTGEFFRNWMSILHSEADIIIGARQAILAPTKNLGLIIVDEEHSHSHKQWDMSPRYDTRKVAVKLSEQQHARLIFGSKAPQISSFHDYGDVFETIVSPEKDIKVTDMRNEIRSGNYSIFSHALTESIQKSLSEGKQTILFVNRRAAASSFMCRDCGSVIRCDKCNLPMSQYSSGKLVCLHCNNQIAPPSKCPKCNSEKIKGFGVGTEKVAEEAARLFDAKVILLDQDKLKKKKDPHDIYQAFETGKADILVATQAGLSITSDRLRTIGMINIDSLINLPDWRADEKAYSMISQAIGSRAEDIIIQTYNPENELLNLAAAQDYEKYCKKELEQRKLMDYPPFCGLVKLTYKDDSGEKINAAIKVLQGKISHLSDRNIRMLTPRKIKLGDIYSCSIAIKTKNDRAKKTLLDMIPDNWTVDVDPESLL